MDRRASCPPLVYESASREEIRDGAGRWPTRDRRMSTREHSQQLAHAPVRMCATQFAEQFRRRFTDAIRSVLRSPTAVLQTTSALLRIACEPFEADASTAVASTQRRHGKTIAQRILDKLQTLVHCNGLQPWHRPSSRERERRCSLEGVLPMYLDCSVTYLPVLYFGAV